MKSYKALFIMCVLLGCSSVALPQWVQTGGPYGGEISCFAVKGTNLFAGSSSGRIFLSTNNGANWNKVDNGLTFNNMSDLAVIGENLFAGGGNGIFLSTNNGSDWTNVNSNIMDFDIRCLVVKDTFLFAGAYDGISSGISRTSDNGSNWISVNNGLQGSEITDLAVCGSSLFAATYNGIYISDNDGASWSQVNSVFTNKHVLHLAAYGNKLFAVVNDNSETFMSTDYGISWKSIGLKNTWVHDLLVSDTIIFAATENGILFSNNDGESWTKVNTGLPNEAILAITKSGSNLFAGTAANGVFLSTDNGTSWKEVNIGLTNNNVNEFAVSGNNLFALVSIGEVYVSNNDHTNWTKVNNALTNTRVTALLASDTNLYAGTFDHGIFLSTDKGYSWQPINNGLNEKNMKVYSLAKCGSTIYASTSSSYGNLFYGWVSIYRSIDGGANWQEVETGLGEFIVDHFAIVGSNLFAAANASQGGGAVFRFSDRDTSWNPVFPGSSYSYGSCLVSHDSSIFEGIAGIHLNGLFRSTDTGTTWTNVFSGVPVLSMATSGQNLFAGTDNGVYISSDNGNSWNPIGLTNSSVQELAIEGENLFAGTNIGVWRLPLTEIITTVDIHSTGISGKVNLEQNYPNPFTSQTSIRFSLAEIAYVSLKVYDINGKIIRELANGTFQPGTSSIEWKGDDDQGKQVEPGIYLCRMTTGNYSKSVRMVVR